MHRLRAAILISALAILSSVAVQAGTVEGKKLIEFGWDEPDTAFIHKHIAEMEKTPFDGCVFHAYLVNANGKKPPFLWDCWSTRAFDESQLRQSLEDMKQTKFTRFTSNFLRFNTAPADLDWFDDYSAILHNCTIAARFAHDSGCKGILFDTEEYNHPLFNYSRQRDAKTKSWEEYARQVRKRGSEVMLAFQQGYPDATIFLTFGYSLPFEQAGGKSDKLLQVSYGLLAPFMDGMVEAATGKTRIVDGCELSYAHRDPKQFAKMYQTMSKDVLSIVADPKKYAEVFSLGFGIWMDENWRELGWETQDVQRNYFTPDGFERAVRAALQTSDEYVWIYTEQPRWWTDGGGPAKLPPAYEQSIRRARGVSPEHKSP